MLDRHAADIAVIVMLVVGLAAAHLWHGEKHCVLMGWLGVAWLAAIFILGYVSGVLQ